MHIRRKKLRDGTFSPYWTVEVLDRDGQKRSKRGPASKLEARRLGREWQAREDSIRRGFLPRPKKSEGRFPIRDVYTDYLAWGETHGGHHGRRWATETQRKKRERLGWWWDWLKISYVSDLIGNLSAVEKGLQELKRKGEAPRTLWNFAMELRAFCSWAVEQEYLESNPLRKLKKLDKTPKEKTRAPTIDEMRRVLEVAPEIRRLTYEVGLCSGLRRKELASLLVRHLDTDLNGLVLDAEWTKNGKEGFQPLPRQLVQRLQKHAEKKRATAPLLYVPSHAARDFDKDLERAGVPKRTAEGKIDFHGARRAFCTLLLELGANPAEVQALMRHSDPRTTLGIYARARSARLGELAEEVGNVLLSPGNKETPSGKTSGVSVEYQETLQIEDSFVSDSGVGTSEEPALACAGSSIPPASTKYCWKLKSLAQSRPVGYPRRAAIVSQGVANAWVMGAVPRRDDGRWDGVEKFDTRTEFCSLALGSFGTSAIPSRYEMGLFCRVWRWGWLAEFDSRWEEQGGFEGRLSVVPRGGECMMHS